MVDTFTKLDLLNSLPKNIIDELIADVDILTGAPEKFLRLVLDLELTIDLKDRANKAKKYIDDNNGLKEIKYSTLDEYLSNPSAVAIETWRKLYVLERSIKPRFGDYFTWFERLKVFYNTNKIESQVIQGKYNGHKLYFLKGTEANPTNHDKLVYGAGKAKADFYFFDDSLPGDKPRDKMVKVELKRGSTTLESEIKKYKDSEYLYDAKYLILCMNDQQYYMVNYNTDPATVTVLDIPAPTGLFFVKN